MLPVGWVQILPAMLPATYRAVFGHSAAGQTIFRYRSALTQPLGFNSSVMIYC